MTHQENARPAGTGADGLSSGNHYMNSTFGQDCIENSPLTQARSPSSLHKADLAAAGVCSSPLVGTLGGLPEPSFLPPHPVLPGDTAAPPANEEPAATPPGAPAHPPAGVEDIVGRLRELLGHAVVLLPVPHGQKGCLEKGWSSFTIKKMEDPVYLAQLEEGNIAVLAGKPSGQLCSIDLDDEGAWQRLLDLNPWMADTLRTKAERPGNVWLRVIGAYPKSGKITDADGKDLGEWRADGNMTMIDGRHPSGCSYQMVNAVPPMAVPFDQINWPDDWPLPWQKDPYDELVEAQGQP